MDAFDFGPFSFTPLKGVRINGTPSHAWDMHYASERVANKIIPDSAARADVIEAFGDARGKLIARAKDEFAPAAVLLIDFDRGEEAGRFYSDSTCGMTPGLIDDRSRYWLRSEDRRFSRPVTLSEFAQIAVDEAAAEHSWIAGLLPGAVLAGDSQEWRAPSHFELRNVVGEGSFTGFSGARAAELVGVSPQNFRKYMAKDGASTRQNMSFAMWHLLLHKLGVKRA